MPSQTTSNQHQGVTTAPAPAPGQYNGIAGTLKKAGQAVVDTVDTATDKFWDAMERLQKRELGHQTVDRATGDIRHERQKFSKRVLDELLFNPVVEKLDLTESARHMFGAEAVHGGHETNKESSAKAIGPFVKFFDINMDWFVPHDISEYKTFNDFFTRKLAPGVRPIASPDDPTIVISAADCRLVVYESVSESTEIWIKGANFSIATLIEDRETAKIWADGPIASFRLSPQDYHHYHSPVDGKVEWWRSYEGTYYGVDPKVTNSKLNELCANARSAVCINSPTFGRVLYVAIGALQVGAVSLTENVKKHGHVNKGDEIGHFSYGGSNVLVMFENGKVQWDQDLVDFSKRKLEANVKMGERIGRVMSP